MEAWESKSTFKGLSYLLATLGLELKLSGYPDSWQDFSTPPINFSLYLEAEM